MQTVERVGIIPRAVAETLGVLSHGFSRIGACEQIEAIERELVFAERPGAERDPARKQVIPYGVLCRGEEVFAVERLVGGGEARLHGKISIGIGGHINPLDHLDEGGLIRTTLSRELAEELDAVGIVSTEPVGFINDDTQPVGQVHLGIVFRVEIERSGWAAVRELEALRGGFLPWSVLRPLRRRMETWSAFVHQAHEEGLLA